MALVDTSVWIDHLRRGSAELSGLLDQGAVLCHPFVVGELACGNLRRRDEILGHLQALPEAVTASHDEVLHLVHDQRLQGQGIGWVDAHLLASARLSGCRLWTRDRALAAMAAMLGVGMEPRN